VATEVTFNVSITQAAITELGRRPELQAHLNELADELAGKISDLSPGSQYPQTIETAETTTAEGYAAAAVFSKSPLAHLIEFGTGMRETREGANRGEMPAFAPFRLAIDSMRS